MNIAERMAGKTPEQRKASAKKGVDTRKRNRENMERICRGEAARSNALSDQIVMLEERLAALQHHELLATTAIQLTGKSLLRESEIVAASTLWTHMSGVYFLIDDTEVVYVGQSVNVYARIAQHKDKQFDRYAIVPCAVNMLDKLESLYIHCLRPRQNGHTYHGAKTAPFSLDSLLGIT